jgi:glycosyltransferase involved in cell wall biosynthesis
MKLSLCMIVKPDDKEAKLLDRCLSYVAPYVDEICLTITGENKKCEKVAKKYKAKVSHFEWIQDFAAARNFNFSQATGDYILWLDCDDVLKGAEHLKETLKEMTKQHVDAGVMHYLYDFNENGECTVKHLKTRLVKNDGCVTWVGEVHEDFNSNRELKSYFIEDIEVLHLTEEKRTAESGKRNLEIAFSVMEKKPNDPRSLYLVANALMGVGKYKESVEYWLKFIEKSQSEEEKYLAYLFLADIHKEDYEKASDFALQSLKLRPTYPNAYFKLGQFAMKQRKLDNARNFIEIGLQLPIPELEIIVFNPREYDYYPLNMLLDIAFEKGEFVKVGHILDKLLELYPKDESIINKKAIYDFHVGELKEVDKVLEKADTLCGEELREYLDSLSKKLRMHPKICVYYNENFVKMESSGRDLVYYCGYTTKAWSPKQTSVGGSEEAVINLSRELAKLGWNVTVYNNCGKDAGTYDGVEYKPFWMFNVRDMNDVTIYWRHPRMVDYHLNGRAFVDMHDVLPAGEFNKERLSKIEKVFLKSNAHKILFPTIPDEKVVLAPNGIDLSLFEKSVERNPYLILNTSSPERHLDATLDVFEELIQKQPEKPWKLAWYYGWGVYDDVHEKNEEMMAWKKKQTERFDNLVKEGRAEGGYMLPHSEIAKKYLEAGVFLYPTQFYEIDCISARKAQIAGCKVVTSDFAALKETVQFGAKIHTEGEKWGRESTFGDTGNVGLYVESILDGLGSSEGFQAKHFGWNSIANKWHEIIL